MTSVVLLWHVHEVDGVDDEKLIGVYRSEDDAVAAIDRLKNKPGFAQAPSGFLYEQYELNKNHWTEGFARRVNPRDKPQGKPPANLGSPMKIVPEQECREWGADFSWDTLKPAYPQSRNVSVTERHREETVLGRLLTECISTTQQGLFWITAWGIFPSSENTMLFDGYRKSLGENRTIGDALGHLFDRSDLRPVECLLDLTLYFYWDAILIDESLAIRTSHDECCTVYGREKPRIQQISNSLERI